ncbi:DUF2062 domain-containing protein [Rhodobacter sp. HX-7-19]|uniref:DUF2062 domain-containing protein n=1 Tax=Paragemmobacter kunshanensis TaxID=2583234 RepID=A0A6M1U6M9_9RHOB|nr:DUF2062 domain-containing protein [Rhodobacter kunshanensis]NGQ92015.1 DUF2062 domain-containing protein [Rhodobacter kunshanensis]
MRDWLKGLGRLRHSLEGNRVLRPVAHWLSAPSIWHVSRRSVSRGVAVGLFCAFVLPVGQVFLAAVIAAFTRSNLITASLATLVTNPLTMPPVWYMAWWVGRGVLGPTTEIRDALEEGPVAAGFLAGLSDASLQTACGLLIFAVASSVLGYVLVHLTWSVTAALKMRRRRLRRLAAGQA